MLELTGARELLAALDALDKKVSRSVAKKAARGTMKPVLRAARTEVKGLRNPTGDLAESLAIKVTEKDRIVFASVVAGKKKRSRRQLEKIGAGKRRLRKRKVDVTKTIDAYYAHMVEAGHKPGGWHAQQQGAEPVPAYPFMGSAWDAIGDERLNRDFSERLGAEIEKVWG